MTTRTQINKMNMGQLIHFLVDNTDNEASDYDDFDRDTLVAHALAIASAVESLETEEEHDEAAEEEAEAEREHIEFDASLSLRQA
ncbi:MAG: hypothetical protein QQN63_10850 [Nitrosopumilus sp.]